MTKSIFVSYASEDREKAESLSATLDTFGFTVFFDRASLVAGEGFSRKIKEEIEASDLFIFLVSEHSITLGRYTLSELKFAYPRIKENKLEFLPVKAGKFNYKNLPYEAKAVNVLDASGNFAADVANAALEKLGEQVQGKNTDLDKKNEKEPGKLKYLFQTPKILMQVTISSLAILVTGYVLIQAYFVQEGTETGSTQLIDRETALNEASRELISHIGKKIVSDEPLTLREMNVIESVVGPCRSNSGPNEYSACSRDFAEWIEKLPNLPWCITENRCEKRNPHPRCRPTPNNLFVSPESYSDFYLIATVAQNFTHSSMTEAVKLALEDWNDNSGDDGARFVLLNCSVNEDQSFDNYSALEAAEEVTSYLVNDLNVPVILGADSSARTRMVLEVSREQGTIVISPAATSMELSGNLTLNESNVRRFWRTIGSDGRQAVILADLIRAHEDINKLTVITESGPYGDGLRGDLIRQLNSVPSQNSPVKEIEISSRTYGGEFERNKGYQAALNDDNADALVLLSSTSEDFRTLLFQRALLFERNKTSYLPKLFFPDAAFSGVIYTDFDSDDLELLWGTHPTIANKRMRDALVARIRAANLSSDMNLSGGYASQAYDATLLAMFAIQSSVWSTRTTSNNRIAQQISKITDSNGKDGCKDSFAINDIQFLARLGHRAFDSECLSLITGPLVYNNELDDLGGKFGIWAVEKEGEEAVFLEEE